MAQPIAPRGTMTGWLLFQYPEGLSSSAPLKIRITFWNDYANQTSSDGTSTNGVDPLGGGASFTIAPLNGRKDFSRVLIEWSFR